MSSDSICCVIRPYLKLQPLQRRSLQCAYIFICVSQYMCSTSVSVCILFYSLGLTNFKYY